MKIKFSKSGSCQGYVFAGTFGLLLRQASLGVNFCAPPAAEAKPQKFPYAPLKHNLATRFCRILFLFSVLCLLSSVLCYAQPAVSSTELIEKARELDGKDVVYEGEVIGEVMTRGEYSWVNLNDGRNAVGVWTGNNFLSLIRFSGGYKARGDWLQVKGVFNRACRRHGGDLDIHAQEVVKLRSGRVVKQRLVPGKKRIALILAGVCVCLLIGQLLSRKLKKK